MDPQVETLLRQVTISPQQYLLIDRTETRSGVYERIRRGEIEVMPNTGKRKKILVAPLRRRLGLAEFQR